MGDELRVNCKGALSLILYAINFPSNRDDVQWNVELKEHYLRCYGDKKLEVIAKCIQHYFDFKDINLSEILPTDVAVNEKEKFLRFILDGLSASGLAR